MFKRGLIAASLLFAGAAGVLFSSTNVSALASRDGNDLLILALLDGVQKCYTSGNSYVKSLVNNADFASNAGYNAILGDKANNDGMVWIPTQISNTVKDSELSCKQVFEGHDGAGGTTSGLKDLYDTNLRNMTDPKSWGYTQVAAASSNLDKFQVVIEIDSLQDSNLPAARISYDGDGDGQKDVLTCSATGMLSAADKNGKRKTIAWSITNCTGQLYAKYIDPQTNNQYIFSAHFVAPAHFLDLIPLHGAGLGIKRTVLNSKGKEVDGSTNGMFYGGLTDMKCAVDDCTLPQALEANVTKDPFKQAASDIGTAFFIPNGNKIITPKFKFSQGSRADDPNFSYRFMNQDSEYASHVALYNIVKGEREETGISSGSYGDIKYYMPYWDNPSIYALYYMYLEQVTSDTSNGIYVEASSCGTTRPDTSTYQYAYKNKADEWCGIVLGSGSTSFISRDKRAVIATSGPRSLTRGNFRDVLEWFSNIHNYADMKKDDYAQAIIEDNGSTDAGINTTPVAYDRSSNQVADACLKQNAADSMSWIICPAIGGMAEGSDGIYGTLKGMLKVDSNLISQTINGNTNAAYSSWGFARDIGNITFAILILVVIFSQITGVGIDNYGIKKMLPKIIISGVLINFSFIISQLAVDLSNVIGNNLSLFLSSIANTAARAAGEGSITEVAVVGTAGAVLTTIPIVGGFAAAEIVPIITALMGVAAGGWLIIIPVIIALVIAIIAIVLFFVMLSLQKMLVIACVVVSPLAFACYMLPNTQKLFKQWVDLFKAVLFLFPICSALYGIGTIIRVVVFSSTGDDVDFWMAVLAVVAPLLPFFLAPGLLRKSLNIAGDLGARLQGLGNTARTGLRNASSTIQNTEGHKDAQRAADIARQERIVRRTNAALARGGLSDRQRQRYTLRGARAAQRLDRYQQEDTSARALMDRRQYEFLHPGESEILDEVRDRWETAYTSGNEEELESLTQRMMEFGSSGAGAIGTVMARHDNISTDANLQRSVHTLNRIASTNSTFANHMKNKASDAFGVITNGGRGRAEHMVGTRYVVNPAGAVGYQNFGYFARHNEVSTSMADWSTQSAATLRRAVENGSLTADMARQILESNDPAIRSGINSEANKADILRALVYQHDTGAGDVPLPTGSTETQVEANTREYAPRYTSARDQAAAEQAIRDSASEQFDVSMGGGQTATIRGYSPHQNIKTSMIVGPGGTFTTVSNDWQRTANGDHTVVLEDDNTWTAETGDLTLSRRLLTDQRSAIGNNEDAAGFRFADTVDTTGPAATAISPDLARAGVTNGWLHYTRTIGNRTHDYYVSPTVNPRTRSHDYAIAETVSTPAPTPGGTPTSTTRVITT